MTWLTGAGSIFALFGNSYDCDERLTAAEVDRLAIASDWMTIGDDIRLAITQEDSRKER
jgi:hypothetical protein